MSKLSVELGLPGLKIGVSEINLTRDRERAEINLTRDQERAERGVGPFLFIARQCGLALDTGYGMDNGASVIVWSTHGQQQQFWSLWPTGYAGEFTIRAELGGLALDATTDPHGDNPPVLWRHHGESQQRWRLLESPDGVGHFLQSVHSGKFLAMDSAGQNGWVPRFEADRDQNSWGKQWLVVRVYANKNK